MVATTVFSCLLISNSILLGHASEFLSSTPKALSEFLSEESIRTTFLEEVEGSLGTSMNRKRTDEIEAQLKPIYTSLPKNEHGNLGHVTVRYALHRLFVLRHGWNIKGLDPNGESWNSSTPTGVLKDQAPAYVHGLFEQRLGNKGLGLHELAVMGATIEHLIHNEAIGRLGAVFNVHQILPTEALSDAQATEVLDTYMMAYIMGENLATLTLDDARKFVAGMPEVFGFWHDTQEFVRGIRSQVTASLTSKELSFTTLAKVVELVGEQFGTFQNSECTQMKQSLMKMGDRGTGRVKLADFYKPALDGAWQFSESVGYLRQLGALDESDSSHPSVIISNYMLAEGNCIAGSGFYSVCCMNEGEGLLGHIEKMVAAPEAKPAIIAALVENLSSSSVTAPRQLPATLIKRLDDIAAPHDGVVPLHGRLFGQWMHHAFPREFPLPHLSGTTSQQTAEEWMSETSSSASASQEEMVQFSNKINTHEPLAATSSDSHEALPWLHEEELLVPRTPFGSPMHTGPSSSPFRKMMLLLAVTSVAYGAVQMFKGVEPSKKDTESKYFV